MNYEKELEQRANTFKSLSHISRLLIFNLLLEKARSGEELASILKLTPATISHHLTIMTEAELIKLKKEGYSNFYEINRTLADKSLRKLASVASTKLEDNTDQMAFKNKVIQNFFDNGRLIKYPSQKKKQALVLEKIAKDLEPNKKYSEKELSLFLADYFEDFATLRRGMVEHKLMSRENGIYQLIN